MTENQDSSAAATLIAPKLTRPYHPRNAFLLVSLVILLCVWFALARAGLMLRNAPLLTDLTSADIGRAFLIGLRFDIATAGFFLVPFFVLAYLPFLSIDRSRRMRRVFYWTFMAAAAVCSYLLLAEFEFFREFQVRYNQLAITYMDQPRTVVGMVWHGYPVVRYSLVWLGAMAALGFALRWLMNGIYGPTEVSPPALTARYAMAEIGSGFVVVAILVIGIRGGVQSEPLRWGDAFKSQNDVANQLSLNGLYTLGDVIRDQFRRRDTFGAWTKAMPADKARRISRELLIAGGDTLLAPADSTVLRVSNAQDRTIHLKDGVQKPNVVVVIMESFSAQFCGACGRPDDFTPSFSALAREGVLFDRAFSIGTHTHQGIFGTLLGFPNLPGFETLMQQPISNQPFLSLPRMLQEQGYQTMFLYNGSFDWDNMQGFFRKQGMDRFIGARDFDPSVRRDAVWGVDDLEVFKRANTEFEAAAAHGPFLGVVLTLSNHDPFDLPHFPGEPSRDYGEMTGPIRGIRYADFSVGQFIEDARKLSYFKNTLFVFVGDHGSRVVGKKLTAVSLLTHHVPLLFFGPGVMDAAPTVDHTVTSQLNITPTVLGLLGSQRPHASWGRDLFTTEGRDKNIALFKGSGGDNSAAIVRGDYALVVDETKSPVLYRYGLSPEPFADRLPAEEAMGGVLHEQMLAIIQSAMGDLRTMKAGVPATNLSRP